MKFRIRHADKIVGLFVIVAAAALLAGIALLGANQRLFSKSYHFITRFSSGAGAAPGTAILMKGFEVGKILRSKLNAANEVDAEFTIYDTYYPKARENSILELVTSPIGLGTQLLFHPGKGEALLKEGTFVPTTDSPEGLRLVEDGLVDIPPKDDTITRLLSTVNPLLENVNKAVITVNRTLTEVNRAFAGESTGAMGRIVSGAADAVGRVDGLVGNVNGLVGGLADDVDGLLAKLGGLVGDVDVLVNEVKAQAGQLVARADGIVSDVAGQASGLISGVGNQAMDIAARADEIASTLSRAMANVEATTAAISDPTGLVPRLLDPKGSLKTILDDKNALYLRIDASVASVEATLKSVQAMAASLNAQMPSLAVALEEGKAAIKQAQDVLQGLKNNPLIKGGVPERLDQQSLYQSMREGSF
jgi:phospholipid/cholesterol/gamma-HCH transport system substrate-binding protein